MKSSVEIPNWELLNRIFNRDFKHLDKRNMTALERAGIRCVHGGKHDKLYLPDGFCVTVSKSGNQNCGRWVLRNIRSHFIMNV